MTVTSPLRGPKSSEGGGFAAAHFPGTPRRVRGRPSGLQGAPHRAARDSPAGCPGPRRPLRPLGPGRAGRPRPAPALRAARKPPRWRGHRTPPKQLNWCSIVRRNGKITNLGWCQGSSEADQGSSEARHRHGGGGTAAVGSPRRRPGYGYSEESNRAQMVRVVLSPSIPHSSATARTMSNPWCRVGSIIPWFQGPPLSWTSIRA